MGMRKQHPFIVLVILVRLEDPDYFEVDQRTVASTGD